MTYKITVVIPAFNSESTVGLTVNSVLSQSSPADEVIVVNDGSTDATADVVGKFGNRVRLISQTNQGVSVARQIGSLESDSDYIAYIDADDWWPEDKLETCRKILEAEDVDFLIADLQRARPGDSPEMYLPRNSSFFPRMWNYLDKSMLTSVIPNLYKLPSAIGLELLLDGFPVYPSTILLKKHSLEKAGGWNRRFPRGEDFDLGLRMAGKFPLHYYHNVQAILGLHDVNSDVHKYVALQTEHDLDVLSEHYKSESENSPYRKQIANAMARKYYSLGNTYRKSGSFKPARKAYFQALRWPGKRLRSLVRFITTLRP